MVTGQGKLKIKNISLLYLFDHLSLSPADQLSGGHASTSQTVSRRNVTGQSKLKIQIVLQLIAHGLLQYVFNR